MESHPFDSLRSLRAGSVAENATRVGHPGGNILSGSLQIFCPRSCAVRCDSTSTGRVVHQYDAAGDRRPVVRMSEYAWWLTRRCQAVLITHPSAKSALGWGTRHEAI